MNGSAIAAGILQNRELMIPVISLTAFDSNESRQRAKQAGAVGYLRKPVDDQALLDTIRWVLSHDSSSKEQITTK